MDKKMNHKSNCINRIVFILSITIVFSLILVTQSLAWKKPESIRSTSGTKTQNEWININNRLKNALLYKTHPAKSVSTLQSASDKTNNGFYSSALSFILAQLQSLPVLPCLLQDTPLLLCRHPLSQNN